MKPVWKWILGILAVVVVIGVLVALPFIWHQFLPNNGFMPTGHMPIHDDFGYGWHSPMMRRGFSLFGFGMLFSGLIRFGVLILIVLGIIWLIQTLNRQNNPKGN